MKRNYLCLLLFFCVSPGARAQQNSSRATTHVTRVTFLNPGISHERSIGNRHTLHGQLFMNTAATFMYSSTFGGEFEFYFDPALQVQYRYYYNHNQRQQKGRRTEANSMNYLSPLFKTVFSKMRLDHDHPQEKVRRPVHTVGAVWGLQLNGAKRFSIDLNLGVGYTFSNVTAQGTNERIQLSYGEFTTLAQISLGFWLNRRL